MTDIGRELEEIKERLIYNEMKHEKAMREAEEDQSEALYRK